MQQPAAQRPLQEYDSASLARELVDVIADKKGGDVTLLEVGKATTLADYFVIATGTSDRQVGALSQGVQEYMDMSEARLLNREGVPEEGWVLLDYGQVVVHIFGPEQRAYYDLERRWQEAPLLLRMQ